MPICRGRSWAERKSSSRRMESCMHRDWRMVSARLGVMPLILVSSSGCSSMTVRTSSPKASTSRRAVAIPTPLMAPEARYSSTAFSPTGIRRSTISALSCSPYVLWRVHWPWTDNPSPGLMPGMVPTTVTSSPSGVSRRRMVYPFSSLR